jgi:hypothetical protein
MTQSVHEEMETTNKISLNITVSQYTNRRGLETELHCVWWYDSVTTRTEGDSKQFPYVWRYDSVGTRREGDYKQNFLAYDGRYNSIHEQKRTRNRISLNMTVTSVHEQKGTRNRTSLHMTVWLSQHTSKDFCKTCQWKALLSFILDV